MQFSAQPHSGKENKSGGKWSKKGLITIAVVIGLLIVALQIVIVILMVNPGLLIKDDVQVIVGEVAQITTVNLGENPTVAVISDANKLRSENDIHGQVYKDAQNGDYVLGYSDKMIIYRRQDKKIIYEGSSPGQLLKDSRASLVKTIDTKAKAAGLIAKNADDTPQVVIVTDTKEFKQQNAKFYAELRVNDVVAIYNELQVIVIYRQDTGEIVKSGDFGIDIDANNK